MAPKIELRLPGRSGVRAILKVVDHAPFRFAISATFTAEPIQQVLTFWGRRLNANFEVRFAPYNQILQSLLDASGELAQNHHGLNVLLVRVEDLAGSGNPQLQSNLQQLAGVLRDAAEHFSVPVLLVLCPPSEALAAAGTDASRQLAAALEDVPGVQFFDYEQVAKLYPADAVFSPEGERLGRIPYTELYFAALGTAIVRLAHALYAPPYKVIALDCDNTLWQGICGEDGPLGIVVDPPRRALQKFMTEQRDDGMLLAMASKNNEPDVVETFESHPEMPLKLRHFVTRRLSWDSKAVSMASIADELSLGLDSVIFVDDNPKECAEVADSLPEVLCLTLPENPAEIPHFLEHVWAFDHPVVTEEDRNRSAYYSQSQEFGRELKRSANFRDFLESLDLRVRFDSLTPERVSRVAQLTQRTNQFNFTTIRRTEAEVQALAASGLECVTVDVSDRFGEYGLVGVMIFGTAANAIELDTLLLSCRALGRGVEHRMLAWLGSEAGRRGLEFVRIRVEETKKNRPARDFAQEIGGNGTELQFDATILAKLAWKPVAKVDAPKPSVKKAVAARGFVEFADIARKLSTPQQILDAMRHDVPASGDTEEKLAVIWADLLQRPTVGPEDNFFDLGGHSLLAVLLIMRVREAFGVELPIDDVYSATLTLGELARKIEMHQMGLADSSDYEALLAEIDSLSDEEVRRLLAEES